MLRHMVIVARVALSGIDDFLAWRGIGLSENKKSVRLNL